jgi:hypothetical protein
MTSSAGRKEREPAQQGLRALWQRNGLAKVMGKELGKRSLLLRKMQAD